MKRTLLVLLACCALPGVAWAANAELISVKKIWDAGGHNAFTDLLRWHGQWWCVFRESEAHEIGRAHV